MRFLQKNVFDVICMYKRTVSRMVFVCFVTNLKLYLELDEILFKINRKLLGLGAGSFVGTYSMLKIIPYLANFH